MRIDLRKLVMATPLLAALQASPCSADPITISLFSPSNPTVIEGDSITLLFQVTNNTSSTAFFSGGDGQNASFVSGDSSDGFIFDSYNFSPAGFASCEQALGAGLSCYYSAVLDTVSDSGEIDGDSGIYSFLTSLTWSAPSTVFPSLTTDVTIQDPRSGPTSVPEPETLALFAFALAILGCALRGRLHETS